MSYLAQIDTAIDACRAFVLIASPHSVKTHQVIREVEQAHERQKMIIAARLGMTHQQFVESNSILRVACGTAVTVTIDTDNLAVIAKRIANALGPSPINEIRPGQVRRDSLEPFQRSTPPGIIRQRSEISAPVQTIAPEGVQIQHDGVIPEVWPGLWIGLLGQTLWAVQWHLTSFNSAGWRWSWEGLRLSLSSRSYCLSQPPHAEYGWRRCCPAFGELETLL